MPVRLSAQPTSPNGTKLLPLKNGLRRQNKVY